MINSLNRTVVPCDCGCSVAIVTTLEKFEDEPKESWVEFGLTSQSRGRDRLRDAWKVLRGQEPWLHCVALGHDGIRTLRDGLDSALETTEG